MHHTRCPRHSRPNLHEFTPTGKKHNLFINFDFNNNVVAAGPTSTTSEVQVLLIDSNIISYDKPRKLGVFGWNTYSVRGVVSIIPSTLTIPSTQSSMLKDTVLPCVKIKYIVPVEFYVGILEMFFMQICINVFVHIMCRALHSVLDDAGGVHFLGSDICMNNFFTIPT